MVDKVLYSSASGEWGTPQNLYDGWDEEFNFNLDPAATKENAKCFSFYTKEDDGLKQDWNLAMPCYDDDGHYWIKIVPGRVFCNPPYGREVGKWIKKADKEFYCGNADLIVMLLPARTDTKWFHEYIYKNLDIEIRFSKGRIHFEGGEYPAPFPSMLVIWRR